MGQRTAGSGRRSAVVVLRMDAPTGDTTSRPRPRRPSASARDNSSAQGSMRAGSACSIRSSALAQPAMPG
ncbi:hypothetical protein WJ968_04255 [Achromobacter xylosoxidans]